MGLWSLHSREEYWDSPGEFKPERFLDYEGDLVPVDHINQKRLLPFGVGAQVYIGENYGQEQTFYHVDQCFAEFWFGTRSREGICFLWSKNLHIWTGFSAFALHIEDDSKE